MKIKFILLLISSIILVQTLYAQDSTSVSSDTSYWKSGGLVTLSFSQITLNNWASGGDPSVAVNGAALMYADYAKGRNRWENSLDLGYGLIRQGKEEDGNNFSKSDDKINLVTKYGHQIKEGDTHWYFSALLDFRTQFDDGVDDNDSIISRFMAPGYLVVGLGIDYKPNKVISINYIPLTGKFTFVLDEELSSLGAYGVEKGKQSRAELGSYLRVKYKDEILPNVNFETRVELFANYLKDFGNIDVNWQNGLVMEINKVLSATFFTQLIYDDDIKIEIYDDDENLIAVGPRVQFKSIFGAGLAYNFGAKRAKK